jgi:hypothetical protein
MPAKLTSTERSRRHRERKRCGEVVLREQIITRTGIGLLVAHGWLNAKDSDDPIEIGEAIVAIVNTALNEPLEVPEVTQAAPPLRRAMKSVKSVLSLGLF